MPQIWFVNLLIVATVAVLAPLLLGSLPRLRLPAVVVEIVAGVVLGPSVLGWVQIDVPVQILAVLGLAFLLFLAGLEIDLRTLRGRALRLAVLGYGLTLVLGVAVGAGLGAVGWTRSPLLVAIALSATSLGLVVPVLKDAGQADGLVGQTIIASSSVADFAAIVLLTVFFSASGRGVGSTLVLLAIRAHAASGSICKACSPSPRRCSAFLCSYLRCWWSAVCQRCSTYPTSAATRPSRRGYCRQPRCRSS
jgi:Kef-type K+ transport system membrane component KefB